MEKTLGARIAEYRKSKNLRQEDLAEVLGVSAQAVSKWENDLSCPDIMLLPTLAEKLGVSIDELLSGKKEQPEVLYLKADERKSFDQMTLTVNVDSSDGDKVRINLPLSLVKILMESGMSVQNIGGDKMSKLNVDWAGIITLVENGAIGKLVEIKSSDGDVVEIVVE